MHPSQQRLSHSFPVKEALSSKLRTQPLGSVKEKLVKRCGYFFCIWSSRSQVNSGPLLEFQRTLTIGIRLCFRRLTSRSIISTGSLDGSSFCRPTLGFHSNRYSNGSSPCMSFNFQMLNVQELYSTSLEVSRR
ncbi:hypothetical protein Tco_0571694 [Tanacetum coccineum]